MGDIQKDNLRNDLKIQKALKMIVEAAVAEERKTAAAGDKEVIEVAADMVE